MGNFGKPRHGRRLKAGGALRARLERAEEQVADVAPDDGDRPTPAGLWRSELVRTVEMVRGHFAFRTGRGEQGPKGGYDHFWLYAHADELRTRAHVIAASDDVLLEALGLPNVAGWGWLLFMSRHVGWFLMVAHSWGLACPRRELGDATGLRPGTEAQRQAYVARQFLEVMRARGYGDVLPALRDAAAIFMQGFKLDAEQFAAFLRERNAWVNYVWTCEAVEVPEGEAGPVLYGAPDAAAYRAETRDDLRRRRPAADERERARADARRHEALVSDALRLIMRTLTKEELDDYTLRPRKGQS